MHERHRGGPAVMRYGHHGFVIIADPSPVDDGNPFVHVMQPTGAFTRDVREVQIFPSFEDAWVRLRQLLGSGRLLWPTRPRILSTADALTVNGSALKAFMKGRRR